MSRTFNVVRKPAGRIPATGILKAGAATYDITPALGAPLSGFGSIRSEIAQRMWGRLFATALVIDDGAGERIALVAVDLHAGTRYLAEHVASAVAQQTGIDVSRLFLSGTHTHSGPGHIYGNTLYDAMAAKENGLDWMTGDYLIDGIAATVHEATRALRPARVGHGVARRWGYSMNRSLRAFTNDGARPARFAQALAGDELPPSALSLENLAVDPRLQILWAEEPSGAPIGAFATFGAHATAIPARQAMLSSDWFGCAVREAQDRIVRDDVFWPEGASRTRVPIGLVAGAIGDVDVSIPGLSVEQILSLQGTALARDVGEALGETLALACQRAREQCRDRLSLSVRFAEVEPSGAYLEDGRSLALYASHGVPALGGSELGRNFSIDAELLSTSVSLESRRGEHQPDNPQAPKLTIESELVELITGRPSKLLPFRLLMFEMDRERLFLAGLPGEPTTLFTFRLERVLHDLGATAVMVTGVTGDCAGYFTTTKEYERQHYEGACTLFGRSTGDWAIEQLRALCTGPVQPLAPEARFESNATFTPPSSIAGVASRPTLSVSEGELSGGFTSPAGLLPSFGPGPWIVIEELQGGDTWAPLMYEAAKVTDQTREMLVERVIDGDKAIWTFRYTMPHALRGRTIRFVLAASAFGLQGDEAASNPVRVR